MASEEGLNIAAVAKEELTNTHSILVVAIARIQAFA